MAQSVTVTLPDSTHAYTIKVADGLLGTIGKTLRERFADAGQIFVIADRALKDTHFKTLHDGLNNAGFKIHTQFIPSSEAHKSLETIQTFYDAAIEAGLKRNDIALALGGGIIGDMTGFFAATYLRGMRFVQCPTTLLAQVDAAVGGKVAVNRQALKNIIGAFYQPHAVYIDTQTLSTLPERERLCGLAEVVKYVFLEKSIPSLYPTSTLANLLCSGPEAGALDYPAIIAECCRLKAAVVAADPTESQGIREMLNLGHTFAHAYETVSEGRIAHGEAVSIGMHNALDLSVHLNLLTIEEATKAKTLMKHFSLPNKAPQPINQDDFLKAMAQDKKNRSQGHQTLWRLILPVSPLGTVRIHEITDISDLKSIV